MRSVPGPGSPKRDPLLGKKAHDDTGAASGVKVPGDGTN
jgi:hypothetical protein